jgi:hypothetical protein
MEKISKTIQELLKGYNPDFDSTNPHEIKMVRHADGRTSGANKHSKKLLIDGKEVPVNYTSIYALYRYRRDIFLKYQSEQKKGNFTNIKYIVSFIGEKGTTARFVGVYKVCGHAENPYDTADEVLDLQQISDFAPIEERILIEWGKNTNTWHQYFTNPKNVIDIEIGLPSINGIPVFKSYLETMLTLPELELIINDPTWIAKLMEVNCVYAILDKLAHKLYVGVTYNQKGIYGRWIDYATTGHGDDDDLVELVSKNRDYAKDNFQWCILETLPIDITAKNAIDRESLWKEKLGTREFGYNNN